MDIQGVILAAGRGSRLGELTQEKPKCFLRVGDATLLQWQLECFKKSAIPHVTIVTGYQSQLIDEIHHDTVHNTLWKDSNMVTSLLYAQEKFTHDLIVSYSDILYSASSLQAVAASPHDITIAYDPQWRSLWEKRFADPLSDAETFRINESGIVTDIGQKTKDISLIQGQYMGLMKFSVRALGWIVEVSREVAPEVLKKMDMTTLLRHLMTRGHHVHGIAIQDAWCEIDSQSDFELAQNLYTKGLLHI